MQGFTTRRAMGRVLGLAALMGLGLAVSVQAADPKPNPTAATNMRTAAENFKKQADAAAVRYATATGKVKEAADASIAASRVAVEAYQKLAVAYDQGAPEGISAAGAEASKAVDAARRAADRVAVLDTQAGYASTASDAAWTKGTGEGQKAQLQAMLDARKEAAAVYGKLADLLAGDATAAVVEEQRDQAVAATNQVNIATRTWNYAKDIAVKTSQADRLGNSALTKKIEALGKLDDEILATMKQQSELQIKLRSLERQRTANAVEFSDMAKPH